MNAMNALLVLAAFTWLADEANGPQRIGETQIGAAVVDARGVRSHEVRSPLQSRATRIDVVLPRPFHAEKRYPVVYVLPVEQQGDSRFGDGVRELLDQRLPERFPVIFVAPTFAELPWYADHPERQDLRQESYLLDVVLPFVEKTYPVKQEPSGRLLLGYSKSGWGAWTLLLRHPGRFARAAAWDAPLMMDKPGLYGSGPIFGGPENFRRYQVSTLVRERAELLREEKAAPQLLLTGYGNFRDEHVRMQSLLKSLDIPHVYRDGPSRKHDWHSGWVAESLEMLLDPAP